MTTPESLKLHERREYMKRLDVRPDTVLIADPQNVRFGVKILGMQIAKVEGESRDAGDRRPT